MGLPEGCRIINFFVCFMEWIEYEWFPINLVKFNQDLSLSDTPTSLIVAPKSDYQIYGQPLTTPLILTTNSSFLGVFRSLTKNRHLKLVINDSVWEWVLEPQNFCNGRQSATFETKARRTGWMSGSRDEIQTVPQFNIIALKRCHFSWCTIFRQFSI